MTKHFGDFLNLTTLQINQIIVYVSFGILVLTGASCIFMFFLRAKRKKEHVVDSKGVVEPSETQPLKKKSTKSSTKKKIKKVKINPDDASLSSYETGSSEASSLLTDSHNEQKAQLHTGTMNKALRATFNSVLSEGLTLTMHSDQPMMQVRMTLVGSELRWRSKKVFSTKSFRLSLRSILFIEWGKQTPNFKRPSAKDAKEEACFSLVAEGVTYDFETSSKVERDALVQGFMLAVADHKDGSGLSKV